MYLISLYFDQQTNRKIQNDINKIAEQTGNTFMTDNNVPPHLTISAIEARSGGELIPYMDNLRESLQSGSVQIVSVGALFPYVLYMTPVLNAYLQEMSQTIYNVFCDIPEVSVSRFYQPMQWLPHITLGKKLTKEQMGLAFQIMQERFSPFEGKVVEMGLAKTNPHEDIWNMQLPSTIKF